MMRLCCVWLVFTAPCALAFVHSSHALARHNLRTSARASSIGLNDSTFDPRVSPHAYGGTRIGIIIVDHGSKRDESNKLLERLCDAYAASSARESWVVRPAHMELAKPSIQDAFDSLVEQGCELIVCHPFFLGPGRHVVQDVPGLLEAANARHPHVRSVLTPPLGSNPLIFDLIHDTITSTVDREEKEQASSDFQNSFFGSIQAAVNAQQPE